MVDSNLLIARLTAATASTLPEEAIFAVVVNEV